MKHSARLAALMASLAILAFLPSAQVCGQSRRGGSQSTHSSSSHSSYSHGSSHGGPSVGSHSGSHSSSSASHSRSGSSVSSSSHQSRPSGSSSSSVSSGSKHRPSGGSVSSSQHRPSSGSASGSQQHRPSYNGSVSSGSQHRPSSGGSVSGSQQHRPSSGGSVSSGSQHRPSSGGSVSSGQQHRPDVSRHSGGDMRDRASRVPDNNNDVRRPGTRSGDNTPSRPDVSGGSHRPEGGARRPGGYGDGVYHSKPSGGSVHANRPAPGSRPYADGAYGRSHSAPAPARVHPNPGSRHVGGRPEPREFHGSPAHFSHRGHHGYGHYLPAPPPRYVVRHYWGRDYYYYNDIWYRYYRGRYWVCRPPWGYVFSPLADAVYTACTFAYYFDRIHYYDTINENASTIVAQNETIAANNAVIAAQNEAIARNSALAQASGDLAQSLGLVQSYADAGTEYFYNDGVFYIKGSDGQYTVIVPPAGAIVDTLPDDYEIIELRGESYFKVDDTVYRTTVINGKACFEVLGQLLQ